MKRITLILLLLLPYIGFSQVTIFTENFGSPASTTAVSSYTGYQNYATQTYAGTADVRSTQPSSGYTGATGLGNLFISYSGSVGTYLIISGINTLNYNTLSLSLGLMKTTIASKGAELGIQTSTDGATWTDMTFTMATGGGTANVYSLFTPTGTIPSTANLRLRFIMKTVVTGLQFRIDDIKLTGIANIVLPLELGQFTAQYEKGNNVLNWLTYSEKNVDRFVIMKSSDAEHWDNIGSVMAKGNSPFTEEYTYTDVNQSELSYYQLYIYDYDGSLTKSKIVGVRPITTINTPQRYYNILGQETNAQNTFFILGK